MTAWHEVELRCDGKPGSPFDCTTIPIYGRTDEQVRREAEADGWQVNLPGGRDLCPDHRTDRASS